MVFNGNLFLVWRLMYANELYEMRCHDFSTLLVIKHPNVVMDN